MATEPDPQQAERGRTWVTLAASVCIAAGVLAFVSVPALDRALIDAPALAAAGARSAFGLLLIGLGAAMASGRRFPEVLGLGASRPRMRTAEVLAACLGLVALSVFLDRAVDWLGIRDQSRLAWLEAFFADLSGADLALVLAGVAISPAVAEEIVFRGILLGAIRRRTSASVAVLASALAFGAVHFDLAQGLAASCLGLYLGALALSTRSVRVPILAHAVNNAFAVLAPAVSEDLPGRPLVTAAAASVLAFGLLAAVAMLVRRLRSEREAAD